ncbi:MAG: hypothetical protein ABEJ46_03545, partial [Gemmatimonadota bacterium]
MSETEGGEERRAAPDPEEPVPGGEPEGAPESEAVEATVRLAQMVGAVEDAEHVLVLTHDNPDPDAIASSAALAR